MTSDEIQSLLEPFCGYVELGMDIEANDALEALPNQVKTHPLVLSARFELLMVTDHWEEGVILGQSLTKLWPQQFNFWFHTAFCLHEMKRTAEAKQTLLNAPEAIRETAQYSYNLACYEAQLGAIAKAKALLKVSFEKDPEMKETALDDPDLEPVWKSP